jgi:FkbM family methyltransferase
MSIFRTLKELFILPLSRKVPTVLLGKSDQWAIVGDAINANSFIVSAGVGHSISFEEAIIETFDPRIILLDPSPTGVNTIKQKKDMRNIDFLEMGLAKEGGDISFGLPDNSDEGSFRKAVDGDCLTFRCTSLADIMKEHGKSKIDLLKIDVEGFEYEIIESIFDKNIDVDQICVEIHHNKVISTDKTLFDAASLILQLFRRGYRIVYNKNMDFTFANQRVLPGPKQSFAAH